MKQIKVLVVDDNDLIRSLIISILQSDEEIEVIGEAKNGKEAIERVRENKPDIIVMDLVMPVMDGLEATERIMATNAVPILVVTAKGSATNAYTALSKGALEIVAKDYISQENDENFISKIKLLSQVKVITHVSGKRIDDKGKVIREKGEKEEGPDKVVAIASSTGGPKALSILLHELPEKLTCPVVIAQHITDGFVAGLVEWLDSSTKVTVKEGTDQEPMTAGTVYISPSEKHMEISSRKRIRLVEKKENDLYHPSCDMLLSSAAKVFGPGSIGIILTGMGHDGALGIKKIKEAGGVTVAQDEDSSVVFGMPKVAIDYGCVDRILPLDQIGREMMRLVRNRQ